MTRALIIDDERLARQEIKRLLKEYPDIAVVGEADSIKTGVAAITQLKPDLVFLDIQLGSSSGFDILEQVETVLPEIIFTTAYAEYAVQAFRVGAIDYLMKPIKATILKEAITKVMQKLEQRGNLGTEEPRRYGLEDKIYLKEGKQGWLVQTKEIELLVADGNYAKVYFRNHVVEIHRSLVTLHEQLDPEVFFKANRQEVVNLSMLQSIENTEDGLILHLQSGRKVDVSRRQAQIFRHRKL